MSHRAHGQGTAKTQEGSGARGHQMVRTFPLPLSLCVPFIISSFSANHLSLLLRWETWLFHSSPCFQDGQIGNHSASQPLSQIFLPISSFRFSHYPLTFTISRVRLLIGPAQFKGQPLEQSISPRWKGGEGLSEHVDARDTSLRERVVPTRQGSGWGDHYELGAP